jgi:hypothetical protein
MLGVDCLAGLAQAQHERQDNCFLRAENDKIRCENITMREALRNVICPTCGGPPVADDYFDEQKLRMENARLKEEASRSPHSPLLVLIDSPNCILVLHDVARVPCCSLTGCRA